MMKTKKTISLFFLLIFSSCLQKYSSYDLRKIDRVSPAKKQAWGTCWSFATVSSLESSLLSEKKVSVDLSEYYLDKFNGFNRKGEKGDQSSGWYSGQVDFEGSNYDDVNSGLVVHLGGDHRMTTAAMSNFSGVIEEKWHRPIEPDHQGYAEFSKIKKFKPGYEFYYASTIEWPLIGLDREKRIETIKSLIHQYGAVASAQKKNDHPIGFHHDGLEIHLNTKDVKLDHAVSLIGWNDAVTFENHRGAWLVKDSDHRDEKTGKHIGHFYIMYDDLHAAKDELMGAVVFHDIKKRKKDEKTYSHALHGWQKSLEANWSSVRYILKNDETLDSVGFYLLSSSAYYNVKIYKNEILVHQQSGQKQFAGYYQTSLLKKIKAKKSDVITIKLYHTGPHAYDAPVEMKILMGTLPAWGKPVSVNSFSSPGESYFGRGKEIFDLYHKEKNASFAINLYTHGMD